MGGGGEVGQILPMLFRSVRGARRSPVEGVFRGDLVMHSVCSRACGLAPSKKIGGVTIGSRPRKNHNYGSWSLAGLLRRWLGVSSRTCRRSFFFLNVRRVFP